MGFIIRIILISISAVAVNAAAKEIPQTLSSRIQRSELGDHLPSSPGSPELVQQLEPVPQQYKEVIMYLTPSQIGALESGEASIQTKSTAQLYLPERQEQQYNNLQALPQPELQNQAAAEQHQKLEQQQEQLQLETYYLEQKRKHAPQIEEPNTEKYQDFRPKLDWNDKPQQESLNRPLHISLPLPQPLQYQKPLRTEEYSQREQQIQLQQQHPTEQLSKQKQIPYYQQHLEIQQSPQYHSLELHKGPEYQNSLEIQQPLHNQLQKELQQLSLSQSIDLQHPLEPQSVQPQLLLKPEESSQIDHQSNLHFAKLQQEQQWVQLGQLPKPFENKQYLQQPQQLEKIQQEQQWQQIEQLPKPLENEQHFQQSQQLPENYAFFNIYPSNPKQNTKPLKQDDQLFYPAPHRYGPEEQWPQKDVEIQTDPLLQQKYKLIPYEFSEQSRDKILEPNIVASNGWVPLPSHFRNIAESIQEQQKKLQQNGLHEEIRALAYAPKYNKPIIDNKDIENIVRKTLLEKQAALANIEAIARSPPVVIHRNISITKRKPIPVIKHVHIPVPAPYLVPVPKPFEVKVPQPYPVPLEIINHVPINIVKTEKVEVETPVPVEVEKHVPIEVTKNVYVAVKKPYYVEKYVPVEVRKEIPVEIPIHKPEKLTILRHVWKH